MSYQILLIVLIGCALHIAQELMGLCGKIPSELTSSHGVFVSCRRLSRSEETVEYAEKNMIYFLSTRFIRRLLTVFCVIRFAFILYACQLTLRKSYSGLKLYKAIAVFHKQWGAGCAIMATILHFASMRYFMEIRQYLRAKEDL